MDEQYVRAVLRYFVHLYERGLLYRANRIVNWCPRCASAISDLEVNHVDEDDTLYTIRYPLADGEGDAHDRDRASSDHARGCRRGRPSGRRALPAPDRRRGDRAGRRAARADHRRRARRPRVRHRRRQDHARPRSDGLRDRPYARPPRAHRDRPRREHERGCGRLRRADAGRSQPADRRDPARARICSWPRSPTGTRSATAIAAAPGSSR